MSTRAFVGVYNGSNRIKGSYVHSDGYPGHTGKMLLENYNTKEKLQELISYGDMSSISGRIEPITKNHTFDTPEDDVCVFYHRDRGEELENTEIMIHRIADGYYWIEYYYLFIEKEGRFKVFNYKGNEIGYLHDIV